MSAVPTPPPAPAPPPAAATPAVQLTGIEMTFNPGRPNAVQAVAAIDLAIRPGEFFSLLGPSGSGKTTCLRMIAGFELPSSGRILLDGRDVSDLPPPSTWRSGPESSSR